MHLKNTAPYAALLALASAQGNQNLTQLIANTNSLSGLGTILAAYPNIASTLASASNVTLFAPNNAAIQALQQSGALNNATEAMVQAILTYHVLPEVVYSSAITTTPTFAHTMLNDTAYTNVTDGQVVEVQAVGNNVILTSGLKLESRVVQADVNYTGGVVHIIDQVLTPPLNLTQTAVDANLTALAGALTATDLLDTLSIAPDLTIFAPSNEAFSAIGSAAGNLTTNQLTNILTYHVINGTIAYSSSLGNGTVAAADGSNLKITVEDGAVFVNSARVITADILYANGVIHVIDAVLNPNNSTNPDPSETTGVPQFSGASSASLGFTSGLPMASTTVSNLVATTADVAEGYSTQTGGAVGTGAGGSQPTGGSGGGNGGGNPGSGSSSSSGLAAMPTAAIGAAALFGGAAAFMANL